MLLGALATVGACDSEVPAEDLLTETVVSEHYVYHLAAGDRVDTTWQEAYHDWVIGALELQPTGPLQYHKYRNRAHLESVTGRVTNGFAEPGTPRFHTIWPVDNHEGVHSLVTLYMGHPPALLNEGLAVAHHMDPLGGVFTPMWSQVPVDDIARSAVSSGTLPALADLLVSPDFFRFDTGLTYPVAGSFVRYLLDTRGLAPMRTYLAGATFEDGASRTQARFEAAYGEPIGAAWAAWLTSLNDGG